jgi:hypothetical protein
VLPVLLSPVQDRRHLPRFRKGDRVQHGEIARKSGKEISDAVAFSDSDFAGDTISLRSTSGSILYYRGTPIAWSSKLQSVLALSSCEAEYIALYDTIKISKSQGFLEWTVLEEQLPLIFVDNQSTTDLAKSSIVTKRTKHIKIRYHLVREFAKNLCHVPSNLNNADVLTKTHPVAAFCIMALFLEEL